ncbi:F-box/LRR-repeat protein 15-like [Montipora foliosa]|uniref:F-box/LRR-repeat protein 15-like n=1 Tax=Montipora foliosa TaxID=591990 RepID=UPI0035F17012
MDEGDSPFKFHDLPDAIILQVFKKFTIKERLSLRRVCWKWHHLLNDYSVWKRIDFREDSSLSNKVNNQILLSWIAAWGKTIQYINVCDCKWLTDFVIQNIAANCVDLRGINIEGCFQVSDNGMDAIAGNCPRLRKINLFLSGVSEEGFSRLLRQCPDLESIKLGSRGNCHRMLVSVCHNVKNLKMISIHDVIPFDEGEPVVDDLSLWRLCSCFPFLTAMDLTWCCFITDDALLAVSLCCRNLASFTIRECHQISDRGIRAVLQVCHESLETVHLERLYNITDVLCLSPDELSPFPKLTHLKVIDTSISDIGVTKIVERSPNLESLVVGEHCFNPYNLHGGFICTVAETCKKLKQLRSYSGRMKDSFLIAISDNLPLITDLYLGDCRDCSSEALSKVITSCRWLRVLNIQNCINATSDTMALISRHLNNLRELEILNCKSITTLDVLELKRSLPRCDIRY